MKKKVYKHFGFKKIVFTSCIATLFIWFSLNVKIYKSFYGDYYLRFVEERENSELLYTSQYNGKDIYKILKVFNQARNIYTELLSVAHKKKQKISIAVVDKTCGPGCGELNGNRIEIESKRFSELYENFIMKKQLDHLLFYELGRIFWDFGDQLSWEDEKVNQVFHTGFAIFMRDLVIKKIEINCAPINGREYRYYLLSAGNEFELFIRDPDLTFQKILNKRVILADNKIVNPARLVASMLTALYNTNDGDQFLIDFFTELKNSPEVKSNQQIFDNFYLAACISTGKNMNQFFIKEWKWNISKDVLIE